jgi:adenine nucleotide transporter 17
VVWFAARRVVTTRLQTGRETTRKDDELTKAKPKQKGIFQVIQEIYQEGGLKAFWNGLVPSLILVINPALQYMVRGPTIVFLDTPRRSRVH